MPNYRKKPLIVDAEVYREGLEDYFLYFIPMFGLFTKEECIEAGFKPDFEKDKIPYIETWGGRKQISPGDYIVVGEDGRKNVLDPHFFQKIYEPLEEPDYPIYDLEIDAFAIQYHYETETFDRSLPHTLRNDEAIVSPQFSHSSALYANELKNSLWRQLEKKGVSLEEFQRAIVKHNRHSYRALSELYKRIKGRV